MLRLRLAAPLCALPLLPFLLACETPKPLPGDEFIGAFKFTEAVRVRSTDECPSRPDAGFEGAELTELHEFTGSLSRCTAAGTTAACTDAGQAFFTVNGVDRAAVFDGQRLQVLATEAPRAFSACGECPALGDEPGSRLREDLELVLYSDSQWRAAEGSCDGGVPAPDPDGGILPPGQTPEGFDAVSACGALNERLLAPERCACVPEKIPVTGCTMVFSLKAVRQ